MERVKIVDDIREIHFFRDGSRISSKDVFEGVYSPLDQLIKLNIKIFGSGYSKAGDRRKERLESGRTAVYETSKLDVEKSSRKYSARIIFDDGGEEKSRILRITNYEVSTPKRPNILFLNDGNSQIVLREARTYHDDLFTPRRLRQKFKRKYKGTFPDSDVPQEDIGEKDILFIPEPHLILSLEKMVSEDIVGRITPRMKIVDVDEDHLWYVRDFLPSLRDSPLNVEDLGKHIGTFNGLRLMDIVDGKPPHYCLTRNGNIVNIDPDFITFAKSLTLVHNIDWPDFKAMTPSFSITEKELKRLKDTRKKTIEDVKIKLGESTLLDHLPVDLKNHPSIPRLCLDSYQG